MQQFAQHVEPLFWPEKESKKAKVTQKKMKMETLLVCLKKRRMMEEVLIHWLVCIIPILVFILWYFNHWSWIPEILLAGVTSYVLNAHIPSKTKNNETKEKKRKGRALSHRKPMQLQNSLAVSIICFWTWVHDFCIMPFIIVLRLWNVFPNILTSNRIW